MWNSNNEHYWIAKACTEVGRKRSVNANQRGLWNQKVECGIWKISKMFAVFQCYGVFLSHSRTRVVFLKHAFFPFVLLWIREKTKKHKFNAICALYKTHQIQYLEKRGECSCSCLFSRKRGERRKVEEKSNFIYRAAKHSLIFHAG